MRKEFKVLLMTCAILAAPAAARADDAPAAKALFGAAKTPAPAAPRVFGGYAKGCLWGAAQLAQDGPGWSAMRLSRDRRWGHPSLIAFIQRLAAAAPSEGLPGILIGDMGQPRGGPMRTGHASHQIGLDADIWLLPAPTAPYSSAERESVSSIDLVPNRYDLDEAAWPKTAWRMIRRAALDPAVERIFVNAAIKRKLCAIAGDDRAWLSKIRPWWGHDAHFHVRLRSSEDSPGCAPQSPPADDEDCGPGLDWWFTEAPYADTGAKPRPDLTMMDLPPACRAALTAR